MIDTMDKHSCELFLEDALEIGRRLVETGAEVKRVEDTVRRICIAYGFTDCEIYAVTSLIVATIRDKDGNHYTQSVRVQSYGTDLGRLEELNAFSRRICAQVPDVEDLTRQIRQYKKGKPKPVIKCLGYMLAAGGFSRDIFFRQAQDPRVVPTTDSTNQPGATPSFTAAICGTGWPQPPLPL